MAFDGITSNAIVNELKNLINGKIDKIYEPNKNTILFGIYLNGKNYSLEINIDSNNYHICLTKNQKENPLVPLNFCMLLRKYLIGSKISNIYMNGLERVINMDFQIINEFNEIDSLRLIVELMGKHSNIILVNSKNVIIDSLRHLNSKNSLREIIPSRLYVNIEPSKIDFTSLKDFSEFENLVKDSNIENISKKLSDTFTGFSYIFSEKIVNNFSELSKVNLEKIYELINNYINPNKHFGIINIYKNEHLSNFYLIENETDNLFNLNYEIDNFYFEKENFEDFNNYKNTASKLIENNNSKYKKRLKNIEEKLADCANMDVCKLYGELITSNLYKLNNLHLNFCEVENYYDNNNLIKIPLDIKYTTNMNSKRYFKKYNKLKNGYKILNIQKDETICELKYIKSINYEISEAKTINDLKTIIDEIKENYSNKSIIKNNKKTKKKKKINFSPRELIINEFKVYVGKNNKENDWLTLTFASKNDLWFHTKDIHGSHVILKCENNNIIDNKTIIKCAKIAAKYSQAKFSSNIPVDYCKVKYVKKPNGAKPGMVIYTNYNTINVTP